LPNRDGILNIWKPLSGAVVAFLLQNCSSFSRKRISFYRIGAAILFELEANMFNEVLLLGCGLFGIGLGIVYNKFFIKDYPDHKKKTGYFITIVVFLALTLSIYSTISIKTYTNSIVKEYSIKLEQYLEDTYPENEFVKNGLDLKSLNNDISKIDETFSELKSILPTYKELGVDKIIYDLIVDYAIKESRKKFNIVNYSAKMINIFTDKDNVLTVSSITHGLRTNAIKLVNIISLIVSAILVIAFSVYIVYTLTIVIRERKFKKI
jgi:hypothetical protein